MVSMSMADDFNNGAGSSGGSENTSGGFAGPTPDGTGNGSTPSDSSAGGWRSAGGQTGERGSRFP